MTSCEPQPDPRLPTLSRASHYQTFGMGHFVVCIYILTNVCINKQHLMLFDGACLVAQRVKNLPTMPETQIWSLGREDPLEKRMATHSSILAWRIPWTEEPGGLSRPWRRCSSHQRTILPHLGDFPDAANGEEPACQCGSHKFDPWVWKISWKKPWQPTPVFLPGESHG